MGRLRPLAPGWEKRESVSAERDDTDETLRKMIADMEASSLNAA